VISDAVVERDRGLPPIELLFADNTDYANLKKRGRHCPEEAGGSSGRLIMRHRGSSFSARKSSDVCLAAV
jgi:hypothetical protein